MMTMSPSTPARGRHDVLLVDANPGLLAPVTSLLTAAGLGVRIARTRREMHEALTRRRPSLVLLELDLPDVFGYEALRDLAIGASIPTIVYSVRVEVMDRVLSLELDAEDVIAKPCDPSEVLARVRRVLRRIDHEAAISRPGPGASEEPREVYVFNSWLLDVSAQELRSPGGEVVPLTTGEFQLFASLVLNANKVVRRERLLDAISNRCWDPADRSVDMMVSKLRRKLGDDQQSPRLLKTVRGVGYKLCAPVEPARPGGVGSAVSSPSV